MSMIPPLYRHAVFAAFAASFAVLAPAQTHKELGRMWTLEHPPLGFWQSEYDFSPDQAWMDKARMASLRFGGGCSSSFVSPEGLIMTNHHCARDHIAQVSPEGQDWLKNGFVAQSRDEEVRVPDLTVQQLVAMRDITDEVFAGTDDIDDQAARAERRQENSDALIAAAKEQDGSLTYQVVSLFQGGRYSLYSYRIFDDIRLVAAPHLQAQKFGGDPDNFTYPRFSLDCAFLRAYGSDGNPVDTSEHYFKFNAHGPKEGDLVFVVGNPGSTGRLNTVAQMEFLRDRQYPATLQRIDQLLAEARARPETPESVSRVLSLENAQKAYTGYLDGLLNEKVMDIKREAEAKIRASIDADPQLKEKYGDAFTELETIVAAKRSGQGGPDFAQREEEATRRIGAAYFAVYGTDVPPDATFTLRISDGVVKGFPYNGTIAPWATSLYGLYARHTEFGGEPPFDLPDVFLDRERMESLDMTTKVNFVATPDIIGGNSGSPILNRDLECVGLVFDGNIEMLGNRFVFTEEVARTVCVHNAYIIECMDKLYDAHALVAELRQHGVSGDGN